MKLPYTRVRRGSMCCGLRAGIVGLLLALACHPLIAQLDAKLKVQNPLSSASTQTPHSSGIANRLHGTVKDQTGSGIAQVLVRIPALHLQCTTNERGQYFFSGLPMGSAVVSYSRTGLQTEHRSIEISTTDMDLTITMRQATIVTPTVTVTAEAQPAALVESRMSTSVLEGEQLEEARGQSLGETLLSLPGINGFSGSSLQVKPVIRGLMGSRVLVLQDGVRHEAQSWDEPQAPEIDAMSIDRVEVVRGPSSVLYGSDAIAGVVNVVHPDLFGRSTKTSEGSFRLDAFSDNTAAAGNMSLMGSRGDWAYRLNATGRLADDYHQPKGSVPYRKADTTGGLHYVKAERDLEEGAVFNTGAQEFSANAAVGLRKEWGSLTFDLSHYGQKFFIHPEPGRKEIEYNVNTKNFDTLDASPLQELMHERVALNAILPFSNLRLDLTAAFQYDSRREEGVTETEEDEIKKEELGIPPEVKLDLYSISFNGKLHFDKWLTIGADVLQQRNQSLGFKALIPEYSSMTLGFFAFSEHSFGESLHLSAGLRYDMRSLATAERRTKDSLRILLNAEQDREYSNASAQLGLAWELHPSFSIGAHVGSGWRAPVVAELYTFGRDEGEIQYKVGNDSLKPETSLNIDVDLSFHSRSVRAELSIFRNHIAEYIYLQPTTRLRDGVFEYDYRQADATFIGAELGIEAELSSDFLLNLGADMVRAEFDNGGAPLPRIPATRLFGALSYLVPDVLSMHDWRFSFRPQYHLKQDRIDALEFESPAYLLLGASIQAEAQISGTPLRWILSAENLANTAYADHLSRYKQLALNPGLSINLKVQVPFDILP